MTEKLKCDGCGKQIDPAKQDHGRFEVTWLGPGDPPVSRGGPLLHFHEAKCAHDSRPFKDWENPANTKPKKP